MISLEESWGDHLMSIHKPDMAVSHYIEAGQMSVALKAAIDAQQWQRAADIIDVVGEDNVPAEHYSLLGRYYASIKMYDPAEKFFTLAKLPVEVIKMHVAAGNWKRAYKVGKEFLAEEERQAFFIAEGNQLEANGRYREAEQLYLASELLDAALAMYAKLKGYDNILRLIKSHRPDELAHHHSEIARQLQLEGNRKAAEKHHLAVQFN